MNYKGQFRALNPNNLYPEGHLYTVYIIADPTSDTYTDIELAGDSPFVVSYQTSNTIFAPLRTSTATINIVHNSYLEDIMTSHAGEVQVKLKNESLNQYEWVGYLVPRIYDASYVYEYETIEFEAADCISTLQYVKYTDETGYTKSVKTIASIINSICDACGLLEGYYWTTSKKVNGTTLVPSGVSVSDQNFFTSDTDECWTMQEVLEEICRYFGFTCFQWGARMYFADLQYLHSNAGLDCNWYAKNAGYQQVGTTTMLNGPITVNQEMIRDANATISFKPVYNKVTVKANMYTCEEFLPGIFDDSMLTNRRGDFTSKYEFGAISPYKPQYPDGSTLFGDQKYKEDYDKDDDMSKEYGDRKYRYFHRLYENPYWESVYYNPTTMAEVNVKQTAPTDYNSYYVTTKYAGGTILDLGIVEIDHIDEYSQPIIQNKIDWTRYLMICQKGYGDWWEPMTPSHSFTNKPVLRLKPGFSSTCMLSPNAYLVLNFSAIWERYENRPYINPIWNNDKLKPGRGWAAWGRSDGVPCFRLKIGNKYWNGTSWTTTDSTFYVPVKQTADDTGYWNEDRDVLNNVSWELNIDAEGYKIPLAGVDTTGEVKFEVMFPYLQYWVKWSSSNYEKKWNAYCWIRDLSLKVAEASQDSSSSTNTSASSSDSDITYENVIDEESVNELGDITVKLTTYSPLAKPSYSNVIYGGSLLTGITETIYGETATQVPEENIIKKHVMQYDTNTKQINMGLPLTVTPMSKVKGIDVENLNQYYVQVGTNINYRMGTQDITYEMIK
jgi:hypothetical protein